MQEKEYIKEDNTEAQENQSDKNQSQSDWKRRVAQFDKTIKELCMNEILEARSRGEVDMMFGLPFPLAPAGGDVMLSMIIGDAGVGKSLLARALMENLLKSEEYEDVEVVYLDLEYQDYIAAERRFDELLKNDRFHMFTPIAVEKLKEVYGTKKVSLAFIRYLADFVSLSEYVGKRFVVFVDSFEDFVDDSSDDAELKAIFREMQKIRSTTVVFSHHITKNEVSRALKFRGSMVIKAKLTSMLYLKEKIAPTDNEIGFVLEVMKMRVSFGVSNVTAIVNKEDFTLKTVKIADDKEIVYILKNIYFILAKEKEMLKTELIKSTIKKTGKSKSKVVDALEKHQKLFSIFVKDRNAHVYSLTSDVDVLEEYLALFGLGDISVVSSSIKRELLEYLDKKNLEEDIDLRVEFDGKSYVFPKYKTIKYELYRLNDGLVRVILDSLKEKEAFLDTIDTLDITL